ncbi:MAG: GYD domain-containing protein [Candidatus Bathycorpusculaceae bacterium]
MPHYILLSTLTDEGWKTVKEKPERIKEVNKELEAFGVKVLSQYAVLGPYDFVNIVEAPNNETIAKVSIELGSRGTIRILTMAAIPIDNFMASMKKRQK